MTNPRLLSKSRFKMAMECPTKLFYSGKSEYANSKLDDTFLAALAEGGFQVGELAKCGYPEGHNISSLDAEEAERQTNELLQQENVVIFEPLIRFNNLLIRVDILVKKGNNFELIEVKAKSYLADKDKGFVGSKGGVTSSWKPYIHDIAFQKYVLQSAFPDFNVTGYLMLVNKNAVATTNGLNQKFLLTKDSHNRKCVEVSSTITDEDLASDLLIKVNVDVAIDNVYESDLATGMPGNSFKNNIDILAKHYEQDIKVSPVIGTKCKRCEFTCTPTEEVSGKLSGLKLCWKEQLNWDDKDFADQSILKIWDLKTSGKLLEQGIIKIKDLEEEHIEFKESSVKGLSRTQRQWMQVTKTKNNDNTPFFDRESIKSEMETWTYPLHFIDFETSTVAIPFYKGMTPYEGVAFQFSHHIMHEDGVVEHAGEFLNTEVGCFPNFLFVRELKRQLDQDNGTIFRYSAHENTYLNFIAKQLEKSDEHDKHELIKFIKSITKSSQKSKGFWHGERCMVDLLDLVKKYYYDPETNGSNSIKAVLPAVIKSSEFLKKKYTQNVYGTEEMASHNFSHHQWLTFDENNNVNDPYKTLPKMFENSAEYDVELLSEGDELNSGGLALTAYAKLQFTQVSDYEREELKKALLKYCELDTLAMVMIVEAWIDWLSNEDQPLKKSPSIQPENTYQCPSEKAKMNDLEKIENKDNSFNLLSALTYGNGTIKEDHITSLLGFLLNPDNEHGLGNKLITLLLDEVCVEGSDVKKRLLSESGEQLWSDLDVILEYSVCTKGHTQDTRIIDIILKFWGGKRKDTPDVIVAIENKLFEGAVQEDQLAEELYGLHRKYGLNDSSTLFQFVFLAPKGHAKGDSSFEKLTNAIEIIKDEQNIEIPARYLPWQSSTETSMSDILTASKSVLDEAHNTRYAIDCLNGLVDMSFNVRNERTELIREAIFHALRSIDTDYNEQFPLTDSKDRYSFYLQNKKIAAVFFTNRKVGQLETYANQPEKMIEKYNQKITALGLSDYVRVNLNDKTPVNDTIWLNFNLNGTRKVVNNADFSELLKTLIKDVIEYRNRGKVTEKQRKLPKKVVMNNVKEIVEHIDLKKFDALFNFGKTQVTANELLHIPFIKNSFPWAKKSAEDYLLFIKLLSQTPFFNSIDQAISGHQAHNCLHRMSYSLNFGKMSGAKLSNRVMSVYFPKPSNENEVCLGFCASTHEDAPTEFIKAPALAYTNDDEDLVPIFILYKELFEVLPKEGIFSSHITCSSGNDLAYTFPLRSQKDVELIIAYLSELSEKLLNSDLDELHSKKVEHLLQYCKS